MGKLFGTDGVRGVANKELTPELAYKLGMAGTYVLSKDKKNPTILIGKDTRISGDLLEDALSAGILAMGGNVAKVGVIPTPGIAYLVQKEKADAGIVISASHNPFEYNGIKFFNSQGYKLDDTIEDEIENIILNDIDINQHIVGESLGKVIHSTEKMLDDYIGFLCESVETDLTSLTVAIDCAHGAACTIAEIVFQRLGVKCFPIGNDPDGININKNIGSTNPNKLQELVKEKNADIGLAYDGDADRLIAVDETGQLLDGDKIMYICAKKMKQDGRLTNDLVTATVMSNIGLNMALEKEGIKLQRSAVGDRYVLEMMKKTGSVLGGEQSGHLIFLDKSTTGDGIFASLQLLSALVASGKKASQLSADVKIYPQILVNAEVKNENKNAYKDNDEIQNSIKDIEKAMEGKGRVLIRPSGTEPLVRVMLEGDDYDSMKKMATDLAQLITERLG